MASGLTPDFIKAFNALSPAQQEAVRALGKQPTQKKTVAAPVGIRIPETPLPTGATRSGLVSSLTDNATFSAQPIGPGGGVAISPTAAAESATSTRLLRQFGLEELIPLAESWIRGGKTWAEIENMLYDRSSDAGKVVDRIYPELRMRQEKGLAPISIARIQEFRTNARSIYRAAGFPPGFYDEVSDFTNLIVNDVREDELNDRVQGYVSLAAQAPKETLDAMQRLYGVGPAGLAAYWIDSTRALPLLQKQAMASSTAGAATRAGFGDITSQQAERLVAAGVTGAPAVDAFGQLVQSAELFGRLPGEKGATFSRDQQVDLLAGDGATRQAVDRQARRRAAESRSGGGFVTSNTGYSGFGSSR